MRIWEDFDRRARVTIHHGDCLELLAQIPDKSAQLVVTSPPYNLGKEYERKTSLEKYVDFQKKVITESARILRDDGSICWQVGNYVNNGEIIPLDTILYPIFRDLEFKMRNRIVWQFGHGLHCAKRFSGRYEVICWYSKTNRYVFNLDPVRVPQKYPNKKHFKGSKVGQLSSNPLGKNPTDVWEIPNVKSNHIEKTIHPCQFPVELVERLVLSLTNEGELVVDPFVGVGSSLIASLIHNRRAAGADTKREYLRVAIDRIEKAESGKLLIRPMDRPVYDPNGKNGKDAYKPPKAIRIGVSI